MPCKGACLDHKGEYGWLHMSLGIWCEVVRLEGCGFEVVGIAVAVAVGAAGPVGSVVVAAVVGVAGLGIVCAAASAGVAVVVVAVVVVIAAVAVVVAAVAVVIVAVAVVVVAVAGAAAAGVVLFWVGTSGVVGLRRNRRMQSACPSLCGPSRTAGIGRLYGPSSRWC